jgi:methionyl-tRNA synthetase
MINFRKRRPWTAATTARRTLLFLLSFVSALPAICQSKNQHRLLASVGQQSSPQSPQQRRHEQDEQLSTIQKENARRANEQRQLELKRDTDRLLQLTNELKQYVDKTNENILSLEVIKKAEEIERLAKSVKEKMKGHY